MMNRQKTLIEQGIILSNLLVTIWLCTDLFIREDVCSMLIGLCAISLLIFVAYLFSSKLKGIHLLVLLVAIFTFIVFAAQYFDYLFMKRWMMFVAFLFYASVCASIQVSEGTLLWITVLNFLQCLLLLGFALLPSSYTLGVLSFCYNPNSASLRLMYVLITSVAALVTFRSSMCQSLRIVCQMLNIALCVCIFLTGSRGMEIGLIVFLIVLLLYRKARYHPSIKIGNALIVICIVLPLVFIWIYYLLIKNVPNFDIKLFGYTISTRDQMWFSVIDDFKNNWFCGNYYFHQGMPHNGYIDMINAYGYPVTIAFMWLVYQGIKKVNQGGWVNAIIVAGLMALLLESTGEAASFMGDYRGIMIANLFLFRVDSHRLFPQREEALL